MAATRPVFMTTRQFAALIGVLAAVAALMFMSSDTTATAENGESASCGSVFKGKVSQLAHDDNVRVLTGELLGFREQSNGIAAACASQLSTRRTVGWIWFAVGTVVPIGAVMTMSTEPPARTAGPEDPELDEE